MSNSKLHQNNAPETLQTKKVSPLQPQGPIKLPSPDGDSVPQARRNSQHSGSTPRPNYQDSGAGRSRNATNGADVHTRIRVLKETIPLRVLIGQDVELRGGVGLCPLHDDHNPSLVVWDQRWSCYGCGKGGDHLDWLRHCHQLNFREGMEKLEAMAAQPSAIRTITPPTRLPKRTPSVIILAIAREVLASQHPNAAMAFRTDLYFAINPRP